MRQVEILLDLDLLEVGLDGWHVPSAAGQRALLSQSRGGEPMTSDDAFMALAGVRYCLGRRSYAPSLCCGWLRAKWPTFKEGDQAQILREVKAHIADEEAREAEREAVFAIDVRTWQEFAAWVDQQGAGR